MLNNIKGKMEWEENMAIDLENNSEHSGAQNGKKTLKNSLGSELTRSAW